MSTYPSQKYNSGENHSVQTVHATKNRNSVVHIVLRPTHVYLCIVLYTFTTSYQSNPQVTLSKTIMRPNNLVVVAVVGKSFVLREASVCDVIACYRICSYVATTVRNARFQHNLDDIACLWAVFVHHLQK